MRIIESIERRRERKKEEEEGGYRYLTMAKGLIHGINVVQYYIKAFDAVQVCPNCPNCLLKLNPALKSNESSNERGRAKVQSNS
jgi:hypothetical protein